MDAMSKTTLAEQKVLNLKQELQMLKDSERRLLREREVEKKMKHGQVLLAYLFINVCYLHVET